VHEPDTGKGRDVVDDEEATVVRSIAQRIIGGDSLRNIVKELNDAGVSSPDGKPWGKPSVRHIVLRERNVGLRMHHGQVVGDGDWDPILDRAVWDQVRAVLRDPQRRTATSSAAAHLLSGLARCGVCGAPMRASKNRSVLSCR
jgi:site-specific DNA recombinase